MRRLGLFAMLVATVALGVTARVGANPVDQLYPIDLRVEGGEDAWHPSYFFRLEWERPPVADHGVPIAAVGYRVRDPGGEVIRESRLAGDRPPSLSFPVPPIPGIYAAEIWLEAPSGVRGPAASAALRYDHVPPGVPRTVHPAGWTAADSVTVTIEPPPGPRPVSGLRGYAVSVDRDGEAWPCVARDRCSEAEIDLVGGEGGALGLSALPEGTSVVRAVAVSGAGVSSAEAGSTVVRVDGTRPEVVVTGAPRGWANGPVTLAARATDALSGMAPAGPNGPYTALAVDGGAPRAELGDSAALTVTGEGVHRADAYARDAAGNGGERPARTSAVSIDETPPRVAFANAQDPTEPERIEARVTDTLSGIEPGRGTIGVRETGGLGPWTPLPTTAAGGRLVARWDSDSHPEGVYEFRATGYDLAGNAASSSLRGNHTRMVLVNPLKRQVRLRAGFAGDRSAATAPYGHRVLYGGRLSAANGSPLGGLPVEIVESFGPGAAVPQRSTLVTTAADGRFELRLPPGPSRLVGVAFAGTRTLGAAQGGPSQLRVPSRVRLRASARAARVGGAPVVISGRVRHLGARLPNGGLPVELQFRIPGGDWAEFRTVRTDGRGRFRYSYAFSDDDSRGVRFRFRAYISGGDWPYEPAASNGVAIAGR